MKQVITFFTLGLILLIGLNCGSSEDPDGKVDIVMMETGTLQGDVASIDGVKIQVRLLKDGQLVAQTETDGSYEFTELDQGEYTIQVSAKGYKTSELDVTVLPEETVSLDKVTLDVLEDPVSHLHGVLTDIKTGNLLSDVLVQLTDNAGQEYEALTNKAGVFTFENLPVNQAFTLTIAHEGYEDYEITVDPITADKTFELDVELTAIPEPVQLDPGQGLSVGSQAPEFQLPDGNNKKHALADYIQDKNVVVVFYRGGWWPFCVEQLGELQANYNKIKAEGAELIAISSDNLNATINTVNKAGLQFPVLSDSDKETIGNYNVTDPFNKHIARPSSFVINQDGIVSWTVVNEVGHRVPTADIIAELGKL